MQKEDIDNKDQNQTLKVWTKISDETGINVDMVGHIHASIVKERKKDIKISSRNATNFIILDLINNDNGSIKDILSHNGISSSEDFRVVIKRLCDEGILIKEENDNFNDFKGLFNLDTIEQFIKENNLKKDKDWYKISSYSLYVIGFVIVVLSYLTRIPNQIAWSGWITGMVGWLLLTYRKK
jgi:uncharacterized repeat protein (TIGR04138 family)